MILIEDKTRAPVRLEQPKTGFLENMTAQFEESLRIENSIGRAFFTARGVDERNARVKDKTGVQLSNPFYDEISFDALGVARGALRNPGSTLPSIWDLGFDMTRAAVRRLNGYEGDDEAVAKLRGDRPEFAGEIPTLREVEASVDAAAKASALKAREVRSQAGVAGFAGQMAGGVGALALDPVQAPLMFMSGGEGALLSSVARGGAINASAEAVMQREAFAYRKELGLDPDAGEAALSVAIAGVAGGLGELIARSVGRFTSRRVAELAADLPPESPAARGFAASVERDDFLRESAAPGGPEAEERLGAMIEALGDPTAPGLPDLRAEPPIDDIDTAAARALGREAFEPMLEAPAERPALPAPNAGEPAAAAAEDPASFLYQGRPVYVGRMDPRRISARPDLMQYRTGSDARGVTGRLAGVDAWDELAAGELMVWKPKDGPAIVADGHHRNAKAQDLLAANPDANLTVRVLELREIDGWTAADVRLEAALRNLRQGNTTVVDAAKVLREAPERLADRSLPTSPAILAPARNLARLTDEAFTMVANGRVEPRAAAVVGELAGDRPELQGFLLGLLREGKISDLAAARHVVARALEAKAIANGGEQRALFADWDAAMRTTVLEEAKVVSAAAKALRGERNLMSALERRRPDLEAMGNVIAGDAVSARLAEDRILGDLVGQLARTAGPVRKALQKAAERVAGGESVKAATGDFVGEVRRVLDEGGLSALIGDADPRSRALAREQSASEIAKRAELDEPMLPAEGDAAPMALDAEGVLVPLADLEAQTRALEADADLLQGCMFGDDDGA